MSRSNTFITFLVFALFPTLSNAGIDWSDYGDGPAVFFGWENTIIFAVAALVLFGISSVVTNACTDEHGHIHGGCVLSLLNIAMVLCAICSVYLLIPLAIIYTLIKDRKKKK